LPQSYFNHLHDCLPRLQWNMQSGPAHDHPEHFQVPDHGLFAAGIIFDIVGKDTPQYLIRVLNDYGIGDVLAICHALAALPRVLLGSESPTSESPRLVVNLSLGADLPIPARLLDRWLPATAHDPERLRNHLPEVCTLLDQLHGNLSDVTSWLADRGVLVVAAAGNDALRRDVRPGEPPPPRYPARYDEVLGVAAMRRDLSTPAAYSNRGDVVVQSGSGHISTFGGNVVPATSDDTSATTEADDSVIGIFSSALPGGGANTTGWARWSGTSFSTPIIAGIAARVWAADPSLTPRQVAGTLRAFSQHPHGGMNPDSPLDVPVLPVTQA
jgi:subtilisin family serine protease